ncbi:MocR-like pyridoxine biosynthesis transcription factor PdxR [Paenibacillus mendelii]|uniref:PLP-dependent aminotransferase family protein n=1 Tax=Paenibacillus mendelii TaxID=206163 RepID=A0ABV6J950_9BACL|nr:PLP-dependent aminotransferase family protein [Paenibacillus mendelii]MCQ6559674.1 PLP-dependent aminotransferase family protein [Paenibacillus mendelii]
MDVILAYNRYLGEHGRKTEALYRSLREGIVNGELTAGTKLPPSRKLAELCDVSRGVATQAYDMLYAEGFVRMEGGSGTFVCYHPAELGTHAEHTATGTTAAQDCRSADIAVSEWAMRLEPVQGSHVGVANAGYQDTLILEADVIDYEVTSSVPELFPAEEWKKVMYAEMRETIRPQHEQPTGEYRPLSEAIARELARERGIHADASQLIITNGSMQAIALLAMLLVSPGDGVVLENPTYPGIARAVQAAGGRIITADVDERGIVPADWQAKLLFVTPTRQFPTGAVLSAERRKELLEWANRRGAVIIEDDYDSTFRWRVRPVEPLKALDREDRVIYVGTFSKTMLGELRIGYTLLPKALTELFRRAKMLFEPMPSGLIEQRALAAFIAGGGYERHLRRMRRICGRRLNDLREAAGSKLGKLFQFVDTDAGLHMYAKWLGEPADYERLKAVCSEAGVRWSDGKRYWLNGKSEGECALFGFAHLTESQIEEGVSRIETAALKLFGY